VEARDGGFTLSTKSAPVGQVRLVVTNLGKHPHNFKIGGKKTPVLRHATCTQSTSPPMRSTCFRSWASSTAAMSSTVWLALSRGSASGSTNRYS
jgi:hypothetical protein